MVVDNNSYINRTRNFLGQKHVKYFIGGLITAYAIKKISETEFAHNLAVDTTAEYLSIQDSIEESVESIKEDAEDIREEAMRQRKKDVFESDIDIEVVDDEEELDKKITIKKPI